MHLYQDKQYQRWLAELKERIRIAQLKAAVRVNTHLLLVYWYLGKQIVEKQAAANWGDGLLEQLAKDLSAEFSGMKGFSRTNLFYIRKWYLFYSSHAKIIPQLGGQLKISEINAIKEDLIPQLVGQIPWGHNREIVTKCTSIQEALFYISETLRNNWSRSILLHQIESKLYYRKGKAINNFEITLPQSQADLARETLKNPYNFDFLSLGPKAQERDLEAALASHVTTFLLELGQGFAFMGRQYKLNIAGDDYFIDLLLYHTKLRCYIVVELKVTEFQPEYAGKLNFYLNAVDATLRNDLDQPSIGILLCRNPIK